MIDEIKDADKTKAAPPGKENAASEIELQPHDTMPVKWHTSLNKKCFSANSRASALNAGCCQLPESF
jgi:hypothetical protein